MVARGFEHFYCTLHIIFQIENSTLIIQFNSKTLFKDGDSVSLKLIFPGAIQTCKQIQQLFIHIYKTTQVHQTITGKHTLHFHTKHIHKHSYLTYTMYIQFMTHYCQSKVKDTTFLDSSVVGQSVG